MGLDAVKWLDVLGKPGEVLLWLLLFSQWYREYLSPESEDEGKWKFERRGKGIQNGTDRKHIINKSKYISNHNYEWNKLSNQKAKILDWIETNIYAIYTNQV